MSLVTPLWWDREIRDDCVPMDDVLALQVVQCQCHLAEVEFDSVLAELDTLLQVVAQIPSQQEVHYHKHVLFVLE